MLFWLKSSTKLVPRQYQLQQNKSSTSHACSHTILGQTTAYFRLQLCASSIECKEKVYGMCQNSACRHNTEGTVGWKFGSCITVVRHTNLSSWWWKLINITSEICSKTLWQWKNCQSLFKNSHSHILPKAMKQKAPLHFWSAFHYLMQFLSSSISVKPWIYRKQTQHVWIA